MTEKISGAEALMRSLEYEGVDTLFGYPGGAIMPTFDALYDHRDRLNHILVRHEQAAVHAAQGYARVSGKVGCALVTSGPGAMNTITGIADAMIDSTPLVVICGQVGAAMLGTDAFQEIDVVGVTQPISKWNYQIRRAEDIPWAVARAFYIARSGRPYLWCLISQRMPRQRCLNMSRSMWISYAATTLIRFPTCPQSKRRHT